MYVSIYIYILYIENSRHLTNQNTYPYFFKKIKEFIILTVNALFFYIEKRSNTDLIKTTYKTQRINNITMQICNAKFVLYLIRGQ